VARRSRKTKRAILKDLGGGLVVRKPGKKDLAALTSFTVSAWEKPAERWVPELFRGDHPDMGIDDFILVEDTKSGRIASSLCLLTHTLKYGNIPFRAGIIELVSTHPKYRRRGLMRAQFEVLHQWSRERHHLIDAVDGIPWFYKKFGYEAAIECDFSTLVCPFPSTRRAGGKAPEFRVRAARPEDAPFVSRLYALRMKDYLVHCVRPLSFWRAELRPLYRKNAERPLHYILQDRKGNPAGFFASYAIAINKRVGVLFFEMKRGRSWQKGLDAVLGFLGAKARERSQGRAKVACKIAFRLGPGHPVYGLDPSLMDAPVRGWALSVRVPDLAKFIRCIAPVLAQRISASPFAGMTRKARIRLTDRGLLFSFRRGRLSVQSWAGDLNGPREASFPTHAFVQALMGYRSIADLQHAYIECGFSSHEMRSLFNVLFPRKPSHVLPLMSEQLV
jgi:hypothetical protein